MRRNEPKIQESSFLTEAPCLLKRHSEHRNQSQKDTNDAEDGSPVLAGTGMR